MATRKRAPEPPKRVPRAGESKEERRAAGLVRHEVWLKPDENDAAEAIRAGRTWSDLIRDALAALAEVEKVGAKNG